MDPVESEALTIPAAVARAAREFGDAEALAVPDGVRLSYAELGERVTQVSAALIAAGIEAGDRVALWAPNGGEWMLAALGALSAGAALVPVSTRFTGPEALDVIVRSGARALFVAGNFLGVDRLGTLRDAAAAEDAAAREAAAREAAARDAAAREAAARDADSGAAARDADSGAAARDADSGAAAEAGAAGDAASDDEPPPGGALDRLALVVRVPEDWAGFTARGAAVAAETVRARAGAVRPGDLSDIMFTSGTTGRSKGAMTSHERSLAVARAWAACGEVTRRDRYLVANPFFHTFGYKAGILACLVSGAALVPQPVFDAGEAMRLVAAERITVLPGAPTIYQMILDHPGRGALDLSSLRLAVTGAADVPVALIERMRRELSFETVLTAYGLTEAVVATMCRPGDAPAVVSGTSGRAAAGFEVRIGASEEILLRGPNMMLGYLDDPEATAAAIDADGWLHTGDAGRLDEAGNLTITGRLKDMYICGGFNVYPAEVEQVLARLDGVADAAVVGMPDPRLGEVGRAFVVLRPGFVLASEDVLAFCRERLANYKVPRRVEFRGELPRNPSGKVLKRVLKEEP